MFIKLRKAALLLAVCSIYFNADAQSDTSYYDLGRIRIKKEFAQSVTIKGEDLEKFPAANLSDAIATWTSGTHISTYGAVYVIDGDLINDVNAYSIFDIKSVTLIENAGVMLNGVTGQQSLILITTRKDHGGKSGINVAGQTNLINARGTNFPSTSNASYYHQYYLSAFKTIGDTHFGLSADYQHDASLAATNVTVTTISNSIDKLDRVKLYGFFDTRIGRQSLLNVSINYMPEKENDQLRLTGYTPNTIYNQTQNNTTKPRLLNTRFLLTSNLSTHLNNQLSFNYNNQVTDGDFNVSTQSNYSSASDLLINTTYHDFLIRDNLAWHYTDKDWTFEPTLNLSYRYSKNIQWSQITYRDLTAGTGSIYQFPFYENFKIALFTPSLNVYYKNIFSMQGGAVAYLNATGTAKQVSPFVNLSVDVLRLTTIADSYSWKVFGSYSNSGNYYDYNTYFGYYNYNQTSRYLTPGFVTPNTFAFPSAIYNHSFNNFQGGTVVSFMSNRLSLSYNYEKRQFVTFAETYTSGGFNGFVYPFFNTRLSRIGADATVITNNTLKWVTTINATQINYQYAYPFYPFGVLVASTPNDNKEWTGGWINKFEVGKLSFAADMLYRINQPLGLVNPSTGYRPDYTNSFVLQNAYISYRIKTKAFKTLDVYANTRNLMQNTASTITDNRKFYGLGFKAGL